MASSVYSLADLITLGWDFLWQLFLLLAIFQMKHFLADYIFQVTRHLKKFSPEWDFFWPLVDHCAIHGAMTLAILLFYHLPELWYLAVGDFVIHFFMDRIKASPKYLGRFKSICQHDIQHRHTMTADRWNNKMRSNRFFWQSLGLDQMVHHLTHDAIVVVIFGMMVMRYFLK